MTVDTIYKAYIETEGGCSSQRLDEAIDTAMGALRRRGAEPAYLMCAEETIHYILDIQEETAFKAGFCAALNLMLDAAHAPIATA